MVVPILQECRVAILIFTFSCQTSFHVSLGTTSTDVTKALGYQCKLPILHLCKYNGNLHVI